MLKGTYRSSYQEVNVRQSINTVQPVTNPRHKKSQPELTFFTSQKRNGTSERTRTATPEETRF